MARRRFFVAEIRDGRAEMAGEEARHLAKVLRAQPGQQFEISDHRAAYLAEVAETRKDRVVLRVLEPLAELEARPAITLAAALIKFDRFEWMVEKATELGVAAIVPLEAARSGKGLAQAARKRLERWRRIARESSQQSRRLRAPEIRDPADFSEALGFPAGYRFFLDEERDAPAILDSAPAALQESDTVALLTGPEGGWTRAERGQAGAAGWTAVSVGPYVLRAETAALAAVAVLVNLARRARKPATID
ncbi:MAG: 16S rRNA (uracil(1498)-N(3))-methyltransferase [Acidobacteria bacterium]|nr:16S rRNA (uracil(1498)-N(3))-methyltransferase [Acidobacteriota bacterium]